MPSFWLQFGSPIITGICALLGGAIGSIITYKLNERTRRLDIYRQIYPEKFKIALALMQAADNLYQRTCQHATMGNPADKGVKQQILDQSTAVHTLCTTSGWLLGSELKRLGVEFVYMSRMLFTPLESNENVKDWIPSRDFGGSGKYEQSYKNLAYEVRNQLHLDAMDKLLPSK